MEKCNLHESQITESKEEHRQMPTLVSCFLLCVLFWSVGVCPVLDRSLVWSCMAALALFIYQDVTFFGGSENPMGEKDLRRCLAQSRAFPIELLPSLYCCNTVSRFPTQFCECMPLCTEDICENFLEHKNGVNYANFRGGLSINYAEDLKGN